MENKIIKFLCIVVSLLCCGCSAAVNNKNNIIFNNVGSILVVLFIESIIFVSIAHIGNYTVVELFGMIVIRYLIKIMIGMIGLIPVYTIVKMKDK